MEKQKIDASNSDVNQDVIALARTEEEACVQVFFMCQISKSSCFTQRFKI